VSGLAGIYIKVVIGEYRTADRSDQNCPFPKAQFINDLRYQSVSGSMCAAGTIMGIDFI
jgi:hypothetical protein